MPEFQVYEKPISRSLSVDPKAPRVDVELVAFWDDDEAFVRNEVGNWIVANGFDPYPGTVLRLLRADLDPLGGGVWNVTLRYGLPEGVDFPATTFGADPTSPPPPPPPPTPGEHEPLPFGFQFTTTGGTKKSFQSIQTVDTDFNHGTAAPDFGGSILVGDDGDAEGADVVDPKLEWTVTVTAKGGLTFGYIATLAALTGKVNESTFFHHEQGECLFLGAEGSYRNEEGWTVTYHFATSKNVLDLTIEVTGDSALHVDKKGWEFLWLKYHKVTDVDTGRTITRPYAAYVEQVYDYADFARLEIGGA
jgi:hypothetical protein